MLCCWGIPFPWYSSPPSNNDTPSAKKNMYCLIREGSFGERQHHMHSQYLLARIVLSRGVSSIVSFQRTTAVRPWQCSYCELMKL